MNLVWSAKFSRLVKRVVGRDRKLLSEIERTLKQLAADSKHASLRTHKLKGEPASLKFFCWPSEPTTKFIKKCTLI